MSDEIDYLRFFTMPNPVAITGRTSSITNSFINSIIPVVIPTNDEVRSALTILEMLDRVRCAYCGDGFTEWDHLRPLVVNKRPTGYISEIHNLVPACGKCNQSKGNKHWREWMFGPARLSPQTRGVSDLGPKAELLERYENWLPPTRLDFEQLVGEAKWTEHWANHERIIAAMREGQVLAVEIRETIRSTYLSSK